MTDTIYHALLASIGAAICVIVLCVGICAGAAAIKSFKRWREARAIAKRNADLIKWGIVPFPSADKRAARIRNADLDPARRNGQFSIPSPMTDKKGVWR
jgi:hypothetical protein